MNSRTRLFALWSSVVEKVEGSGGRLPGREGFSPDYQVAFPFRGVFVWHVGREAVVSDPNQVLFVRGGESFRLSEPRPRGYAELIVTPAMSVLSDLIEASGHTPHDHPLFRARSRRASPALQRQCARLLHSASDPGGVDPMGVEEHVFSLLRSALTLEARPPRASDRTRRLIRRTKEFLDAEFGSRPQLPDVARAVGASPAYLTDVFRRFEGISLQRYVTQLRLARALVDLPHAPDLTTLAFELGFSSHSHFTWAFRRAFDCTPSQFRQMTCRHRNLVIANRASSVQDAAS